MCYWAVSFLYICFVLIYLFNITSLYPCGEENNAGSRPGPSWAFSLPLLLWPLHRHRLFCFHADRAEAQLPAFLSRHWTTDPSGARPTQARYYSISYATDSASQILGQVWHRTINGSSGRNTPPPGGVASLPMPRKQRTKKMSPEKPQETWLRRENQRPPTATNGYSKRSAWFQQTIRSEASRPDGNKKNPQNVG